MRPGLARLGTSFGNGERDARVFQRDEQAAAYARAKATVPSRARALIDDPDGLCGAVLPWLRERARLDGIAIEASGEPASTRARYRQLCDAIQEDLVLVRRTVDGRDRAVFVDVCFPSGWAPEAIVGASFAAIHAPVPGLLDDARRAAAMVEAMTQKGPFVRFVWTLSADDHLDHHPLRGLRRAFDPEAELWLRVERQVTMPFPERDAALFAIRTYLYAVTELEAGQRVTLEAAVAAMPEPIARYKRLASARPLILQRLRAMRDGLQTASASRKTSDESSLVQVKPGPGAPDAR